MHARARRVCTRALEARVARMRANIRAGTHSTRKRDARKHMTRAYAVLPPVIAVLILGNSRFYRHAKTNASDRATNSKSENTDTSSYGTNRTAIVLRTFASRKTTIAGSRRAK